jgi:hypothetical protein
MARTIYGMIKHQQFYRAYREDAIPRRSSTRPLPLYFFFQL